MKTEVQPAYDYILGTYCDCEAINAKRFSNISPKYNMRQNRNNQHE